MNSEPVQIRKPNAFALAARVVILTVLITLFCFAIGLLFGIVGVSIANAVRGGGINLAVAYRNIAFPFAMVALVMAFIGLLVFEVRRYRRLRAEYQQWRQRAA